ncbi:histone-like nucleoid-structuring protein Lsr2, partial [Streptomyces rhizosphaericus]|uniref:histone-like nucleoid-structuring protein Lsr2 n=1 Tax=Streptomyces rhizosphaericus TaxID=114699 RepID=UPI0031D897A8
MAQKVHIVLEDDLDGGDASETVSFGLDGKSYEIDLNEENAAGLREALSAYVGHARKVGSGRRTTKRSPASGGSTAGGPAAKDVREWAREAGHE